DYYCQSYDSSLNVLLF
nr:immunoglobulin light chain junction region [Macaca mulatta]MOX77560.1 immunoglobulin light chain junction region [Macaca mulatta]MOX77691.1 immunoglobulin light chain junction region [Macaca mulatta]MOX77980.1 immunoglobulin light chain junction region [Macaca mulatta]MOX78020.1 immunoglobulin light chain junction region [Macaca mulatta]